MVNDLQGSPLSLNRLIIPGSIDKRKLQGETRQQRSHVGCSSTAFASDACDEVKKLSVLLFYYLMQGSTGSIRMEDECMNGVYCWYTTATEAGAMTVTCNDMASICIGNINKSSLSGGQRH